MEVVHPPRPTEHDAGPDVQPRNLSAAALQFAKVPNRALLAAAQGVMTRWQDALGTVTPWPAAADELARLTIAVHEIASSGEAALELPIGTPLRRQLLALLETEVEECRGRICSDAEVDELKDAFTVVHGALECEDMQEVEARLASPDGPELLAEVAHDLRSPLTSILTLADALRSGRSGDVNGVQQRQLGLIYSAALALSSTASNLIELAHGGDRLAQKEPSPFSILEIMESVRDVLLPMAEEKEIELRFAPGDNQRRLGYPLALSRVLLNLATNSLKFTEEGYVEVTARPLDPTHVEFAVRDTGKGISATAVDTLYQPFRRSPARDGYFFSGTGLGLMICRRLVEAMGSRLEFETRPDWGTRFYFELELRQVDEFV
jgi:signal transduction histidine kinase